LCAIDTYCRPEEGWIPFTKEDGKVGCKCDGFVNVKEGGKCQKCDRLIQGCGECEQIADQKAGENGVFIGDTSVKLNDKQGSWVVCKKCVNERLFLTQVKRNDGYTIPAC
jgi:hypothetical protein